MKQNILMTYIGVAVVCTSLGFFAGMKYQQTKRGNAFTQMTGNGQFRFGGASGSGGMTGGRNGGRGGFRPVMGEIIKSEDTSITVKLPDGSSKIILLTSTTSINKAEKGQKEDLVVGTQIAAFGADNADGSVTAQNIQLNPIRMEQGTPKPTP